MFATLRSGPDEGSLVAIRRTDQLPVQSHQHQACNFCREKKLKCTAQITGCDRCVAEGIVCRRDSKPLQKAGGAKAAARRNEANKAARSGENAAPKALVQKSTPSKPSNDIRTPERDTPALTSSTPSASSDTGELADPLSGVHSDDSSNNIWQLPSLTSGNAMMTPIHSGSGFNLQDWKSPPERGDFFVDPEFDAFGLEQDRNTLIETMDVDFSFDDTVNNDDLEILGVRQSPALDGRDSRRMASPLVNRRNSQAHRFQSNPPSQWSSFNRPTSVSSSPKMLTQRAKNVLNSRPTQCDCLAVTLSLLEKVYFQDTRVSISCWIGLLHEFKQWMKLFRGVTDCTVCNCATDSLMLLVVVCEKLGDSFKIILNTYERLAEALIEKPGGGAPDMHLLSGGYSVDSVEEFACLFKFLALRQLHFLYRTILSLDERALRQELQMHHESLQRQTHRLVLMKKAFFQAHLQETEAGSK